jgi:Ca2+-binding RTX toxin-like protein
LFNDDFDSEIIANGSVTAGEWNHVVFTYDQTDIQLYLNGVGTTPVEYDYIDTSPRVGTARLGRDETANAYFDGQMDDVRVYDDALTAAEAAALAINPGNDTLDFTSFGGAVDVDLSDAALQAIHADLDLTLGGGNMFPRNVIGSALDDTIVGNLKDNQLDGLAGDDSLEGGRGDDALDGGGADDDTYVFSGSTDLGLDTIAEAANADTDTLDFSGLGAGITIDISSTTSNVQIAAGLLHLTLSSATGVENVIGTAYVDDITGNSRANTLTGNDGDDTIDGAGGNDTIDGGDGADTLYGGTLDDLIFGGAGDDSIFGEDGDDILWGDAGTDTISGGDGCDTIDGMAEC